MFFVRWACVSQQCSGWSARTALQGGAVSTALPGFRSSHRLGRMRKGERMHCSFTQLGLSAWRKH
eukprot:1160365-Pelagomonas_calceolata.AAC.6